MAAPASAGIWTEIPSGTTEEITAVEYRGGDQFWFTTGSGKIYRRVGGTFQLEHSKPGVVFRDIEFNDAGTIGLAVATGGYYARSTNGGDTWSQIVLPAAGHQTDEINCGVAQAPGDLDTVRIDGMGRAWIAGGGSQIWRSTGTGLTLGTVWADANNGVGTTCGLVARDIDAMVFIPGDPAGYFITRSFGYVWFTSDPFTTSTSEKPANAGNGFTTLRRAVGDPSNTNRMWAVTPSDGTSYVQRTIDGWSTAGDWRIGNPDRRSFASAYDVDYAGGTVLAAGSAGMVLHSIDGETFFFDDADGALATQEWRAASLADGANGAIGGTNGKLAITAQGGVIPDVIAPTGTISGPATGITGQPVTFTLNANDAGGSGLNPASYAWTSSGLPGQSGQTVSFTFPGTGTYTVRVAFADNAGNAATATRSISVSRASGPGPGSSGGPAPTFAFTGRGNSATAKIIGNRVRVRMRGTIKPPAGVSTASACKGRVRLTIKKKRKTLRASRAKLKLKKGRCRFGKTVYVKRSKVGNTTRLRLKVRFKGNAVLSAGQTTKTLVVKK